MSTQRHSCVTIASLMKFMFPVFVTWCSLQFASAASLAPSFKDCADRISKQELQSVVEFLGDDLLEGRAPGTRGAEIAETYVQSVYKLLGFAPDPETLSYLQPFELQGFTASDMLMKVNGTEFRFKDDIVGVFTKTATHVDFAAEAVFVGFGISSALMDWDDYKGVDVRGKLVIARVNDPGLVHPEIFEGKTLTYFGRWTYHIEEAARRGAAGILLIHTDETAGYDWNVVKNSWSGESLYIDSDLQNGLEFRGWIKESAFNRLLATHGLDLATLYRDTAEKTFTPMDLGFRVEITAENTSRRVIASNVIASIPGKTSDRIVLSAHIDHLGLADEINEQGDRIFNGAIDNGSAVAAMLMTAKILKAFQDQLHYSVTILACNAEESGLLGSKYYAQNTDRSSIVANINFESTPVWKPSNSIMGIGARFSEFEPILKELTAQEHLSYSRFSRGNQGLFYRSDQFSFARYGIPSVWISAGEDEIDGSRTYTEFWSKDYHTVKDEYSAEWELEGMRQTIRFALLLIDHLNQSQHAPEWANTLPFSFEN